MKKVISHISSRAGRFNIKRYEIIAIFLAEAAIIFTLVMLHQFSYNSDDIAEQTVLYYWREYGFSTTWLPPDPWIYKFPIYQLLDVIMPEHSRKTIFAAVITMNGLLVVGFMFFILSLTRMHQIFHVGSKWTLEKKSKLLIVLIPLFTFSLSIGFVSSLRIPNTRNLEIALMLLMLLPIIFLVYRFARKKLPLNRRMFIWMLPLSILGGLLYYSDPYFMVFGSLFIASLVLFRALGFRKKYGFFDTIIKGDGLLAALFIFFSYIFYLVFKFLFLSWGLHLHSFPLTITGITDLLPQVINGGRGVLYLFNLNIETFGFNSSTFMGLLSVVAVGGMLAVVVASLWTHRKENNMSVVLLRTLSLQIIFTFIVYSTILIKSDTGEATVRYLVILPIYTAAACMMAIIVDQRRNQQLTTILVALIVPAIIANFLIQLDSGRYEKFLSIYNKVTPESRLYIKNNKAEELLINVLEAKGLTKGYGHYWNANINTYLSNGRVKVLPVNCSLTEGLTPYHWVTVNEVYDKYTEKSFIVFDNRYLSLDRCDVSRFGDYEEEFGVSPGVMVRVYPYDIARRF